MYPFDGCSSGRAPEVLRLALADHQRHQFTNITDIIVFVIVKTEQQQLMPRSKSNNNHNNISNIESSRLLGCLAVAKRAPFASAAAVIVISTIRLSVG